MNELGDIHHAIIHSYIEIYKNYEKDIIVHQETQQRHVQEIAANKKIQECQEVEVVAHTLFLIVVEEVYTQVPNIPKENLNLSMHNKLIMVKEVFQHL
jgi:hypothetical protein